MKCKICKEEYHDTCPLIKGCECCENTMKKMKEMSE
jgi:hypothetical protein